MPPDVLQCPKSLRDLLLSSKPPESLTQRLHLAKGLANAVGSVHIFGFVRKNIRPDPIFCFNRPDEKSMCTFLVGFELFRRDMGWMQRLGDAAPDKNFYRHPSCQEINPELNYTMQHDVYSLGVCLLQIGLWKTFVDYTISSKGAISQVSDIICPSTDISDQKLSQSLGAAFKEILVSLARNELPQYMGSKYSEVTLTCLNFMDEISMDLTDNSVVEDDQEIIMGVNYIEEVRAAHILTGSGKTGPCRQYNLDSSPLDFNQRVNNWVSRATLFQHVPHEPCAALLRVTYKLPR